jgi:hypothetical protein
VRHRPYRTLAPTTSGSTGVCDDPELLGPLVVSLLSLVVLCGVRVAIDASHEQWTLETRMALALALTFAVACASASRRWWRCRHAAR